MHPLHLYKATGRQRRPGKGKNWTYIHPLLLRLLLHFFVFLLLLLPPLFSRTSLFLFSLGWILNSRRRRSRSRSMRHGGGGGGCRRSEMHRLLGLLRVRVHRGINLAVRDIRSSDPYVILTMGRQKLKTRVIKRNINPVWDEDLTLSVEDPSLPVKLEVYDKDTFTLDDPMGNAEFDIQPFVEAVKTKPGDLPNGYVITKVAPSRQNCLAEESSIYWSEGKVRQDLALRLRNVESGEVELQLQWVSIPGSKSL